MLRVSALILSSGLIATGCSGGGGKSSSPATSGPSPGPGGVTNGGTVTLGIPGETNGWDPLTDEWSVQGYLVAENVFDPLVGVSTDPTQGRTLHPYLATSVTPDTNRTHWTITIRPGVRFSDGEPLDAAAVALQFNLARSSLAGSVFGNNLIQGATATNPTTVVVTLNAPDIAFEQILASQIGYIAAPKQLQASPADASAKPIGSGPFKFKEWIPDDHLTLVRNPNYWRPGIVHLDSIILKVIPDENTRAAALRSGQIDFSYTATPAIIKQFQNPGNGISSVEQQPRGDPTFIALNTTKVPLDDERLRQALSYSMNVQQAIDTIGLGVGEVATEPYPVGSKWYSPSGYPTAPDLSKARQLVAAYRSDHHVTGPIHVSLQCLAGQNQAMDLWKQQWSQIGVVADEQFVEYQTLVANVISKNYQAACFQLFGEGDPDGDAAFWQQGNILNFTGFATEATESDLERGRSAPSPDDPTRIQAYGDLWKQFAIGVPYLWATFQPSMVMWDSRVHNLDGGTFPDGTPYPSLKYGIIPIAQVWVSR